MTDLVNMDCVALAQSSVLPKTANPKVSKTDSDSSRQSLHVDAGVWTSRHRFFMSYFIS